jgi:HlyD family secretion protein
MTRFQVGCLAALATAGAALFALVWALWPAPAPHYETVAIDRGKIVATVTATGTLSALVTVQVGAQVSGRILELDADYNSNVTKGEVIARLDPELYQAALEQSQAGDASARANLLRAEVQAKDARSQADRAKALAEKQLLSSQDSDTAEAVARAAEAGVSASRAAVQQAEAALHQAQVNLAYCEIHSPIDGVVISRSVDVGQTDAASLSAPTLFVIAEDLTKMQVDTSVAEADIGRLEGGMPAAFTVDAWPGRKFSGTVRQIRNAPTTVQNVVTYDAVVDVDNADLALKPGMTANVTFTWASRDDAVRISNVALRYHPADARPDRADGATRTVYVLKGEEVVPTPIQVGISDGTNTEVVSGELAPDDQVVTDAATGEAGASAPKNPFRRGL